MNGSTVTVLARDGQKSVRAELQGSTVTGSWRYRAYGTVVQSSGSSTPSILGYAGQLLDPSGLYYMRARWYDSGAARLVSRDPVFPDFQHPLALNAFAYAETNPLAKADPSGMFCVLIGLGAKLAAGATDRGSNGAGAAASENWSVALCDGGKGKGISSVGVTSTSARVGATNDPLGQIVAGLFASFGVEVGVAPRAAVAEDLAGQADSDAVDAGVLWPIDFGLEVAQGDDPSGDLVTVSPPVINAGIGVDYTHMRTNNLG